MHKSEKKTAISSPGRARIKHPNAAGPNKTKTDPLSPKYKTLHRYILGQKEILFPTGKDLARTYQYSGAALCVTLLLLSLKGYTYCRCSTYAVLPSFMTRMGTERTSFPRPHIKESVVTASHKTLAQRHQPLRPPEFGQRTGGRTVLLTHISTRDALVFYDPGWVMLVAYGTSRVLAARRAARGEDTPA